MARAAQPVPPVDLGAGNPRPPLAGTATEITLARLENRLANVLKPIAIPAIAGVSLTMLFFGVLLGAMISNTTVMAHDRVSTVSEEHAPGLYKPVRTTNLTMIRFAGSDTNKLSRNVDDRDSRRRNRKSPGLQDHLRSRNSRGERLVREQLSLAHVHPGNGIRQTGRLEDHPLVRGGERAEPFRITFQRSPATRSATFPFPSCRRNRS